MSVTEHRLGVVGAGTMGNGIAHACARSGFEVMLYEVSELALERGLATIRTNLDREAAKGKIDPAEVPAIFARIHPVRSAQDLSACTHLRRHLRGLHRLSSPPHGRSAPGVGANRFFVPAPGPA